VPWIAGIVPYNAVVERIERLGLSAVLNEVGHILTDFNLTVAEQRDTNGGAEVRTRIDARFRAAGWTKEERGTGDIDWIKRVVVDGTTLAVGVEVQVSGRGGGSHLSDLTHLATAITQEGRIDVAVMVVPTDRLAVYLTDRVEGISKVQQYVKAIKATDLPILVVAIEHDGPGPALPKQRKRSSGAAEPAHDSDAPGA
jgi:hypothetical protein